MTDQMPFGGDRTDDDETLVMGYTALAKFLTASGFPISKSSLQKFGMPSVNQGPPNEGFWGNLPAFKRSLALAWARSRIGPRAKRAASPAPNAASPDDPHIEATSTP
jgi:hypothetical protein